MVWHGWLWSRNRWEHVCQADDLGACARQLGRIGDARGIPARHRALTGGAVPTFLPRHQPPYQNAQDSRQHAETTDGMD